MYPKAELLFPPRLIPILRTLRGPEWAALVRSGCKLPETTLDSLAFSLLMIRLDGCVKCHEGSFKYMRGCHVCATQTITQYKGTDSDLLLSYQKARQNLLSHRTGDTITDDDTTEAAEE